MSMRQDTKNIILLLCVCVFWKLDKSNNNEIPSVFLIHNTFISVYLITHTIATFVSICLSVTVWQKTKVYNKIISQLL